MKYFLLFIFAFSVIGCHKTQINFSQIEKDEIFSLAAYTLVYNDWQTEEDIPGRGHNIGAVLVKNNEIVFAGRNWNFKTKNSTQHAEVRTITKYLTQTKENNLANCTIYTTLEPCCMCAGMMKMVQVERTVYGQTDPDFGKAIERLQLDTHSLGGFFPYPRFVRSEPSKCHIRHELDELYNNEVLTQWLRTKPVKSIFRDAKVIFYSYKPIYEENVSIHRKSVKFIDEFVEKE